MKRFIKKLSAAGKVLVAVFLIISLSVGNSYALPQRRGGRVGGGGGGIRGGGNRGGQTRNRPNNSSRNNNRPNRENNRPNNNNNRPNNNGRNNANNGHNNNGHNNNGHNNINSGNHTTNININNSHNTVVRQNNIHAYTRPPYVYGGRSYYSFHPYYYHPYRPFAWGPVYHPWGFFVAALATTAIVVSVANAQYHYDQGVFYAPSNGGYTVVAAPVGATVTTIPSNAQTVVVNQTTNNYYYGGTYYEKSDKGYTVVPPTAGTVVANLPDGGTETKIGDVTYVKVGETYYQPVQVDGKDQYEVVNVQDAAKK